MNHFDSSDANDAGFRSGAVVVGYDRGEGVSVIPSSESREQSGDSDSFDPMLSYGETRGMFETQFERNYVTWLLCRHMGNISAAAREARMDRKHLHDLAKKHGLRGRRATSGQR